MSRSNGLLEVKPHTFTRSQIRQAEHDFIADLKRYFNGEIWSPPSDGEYLGVSWDCRHPVAIYGGLWRLCQTAKHRGAERVFGKIEVREVSTLLRFIIFYKKKEENDEG